MNETYGFAIVLQLCEAPAETLPWLALGTPQLPDLAKGPTSDAAPSAVVLKETIKTHVTQ